MRTLAPVPIPHPISRIILLVLLLVVSGATVLLAQPVPSPTPGESLKEIMGETENELPQSMLQGEIAPIERPVDPNIYYVGPNDRLLLSSAKEQLYPITVGVDNSIALPRGLGTFDVSGLTLAELQAKLDSIFTNRTRSYGDIQLTLLQARTIYVTVTGNVLTPDRYILTSADRVTTAIDLANRVREELIAADVEMLELSKQSMRIGNAQFGARDLGGQGGGAVEPRRVLIRHYDGTTDVADLARYRAFGRSEDNPTLREGDEIIVETPDPFASTIAISGAVNAPTTTIAHREGDNALTLYRLAAGIRDDALGEDAYIVRLSESGEQRVSVDLTDTASLAAIPLYPGDQIIVPSRPRGHGHRTGVVSVVGEVGRPQTYPIIPGVTTLRQVIDQAGGFTPSASLNGAYIYRPDDPLALRPRQQTIDPKSGLATSSLSLEDTTRFEFDIELQQNRVSADFIGLFENNDYSKDVVLQNGDEVHVPRNPGGVYLFGRVQYPGWVMYRPGATYEDYIAAAGGMTEAAQADRIIVQKFGTGVWDGPESVIQPGDRIYIPGKRDTPARTSLENAGTILFIASSILSIANTIINIYNALKPDEPGN